MEKEKSTVQVFIFLFPIPPSLSLDYCFLMIFRNKEAGEFPVTTPHSHLFCPVPLVKAPHPDPPDTHTHQLSESFPSVNGDQLIQLFTCIGDTVIIFLYMPFLIVCVFLQLSIWGLGNDILKSLVRNENKSENVVLMHKWDFKET